MTPHYADSLLTLYLGDAIEVMRELPEASVDAVVTDPPAAVSFMGKKWDSDRGGRAQWVAWMTEVMRECYRVLKPGGYAVVWSLPRTCHWTAWAMEDAGFYIVDQLAHVFASGFPKGRTQLKPAREDWWLARKPGPLQPLGIDAGRIGYTSEADSADVAGKVSKNPTGKAGLYGVPGVATFNAHGRWPSNVLLSSPELFDQPNPEVVGSGAVSVGAQEPYDWATHASVASFATGRAESVAYGDVGGYSRYFIIPKSARSDREPVLRGQLAKTFSATMGDGIGGREHNPEQPTAWRENGHPTVKPVDLMRHLVRLVTPSGGTILDCFLGSGSTALAANAEGFRCIGIEQSAEYLDIAMARLLHHEIGLGLEVAAPTRKGGGKQHGRPPLESDRQPDLIWRSYQPEGEVPA